MQFKAHEYQKFAINHKVNEGEVPQYYVKNNHEAIIEPEIFDMVQKQMALRTRGKNRIRSTSIFSCKLKCMDCGSYYGSKVWHSNSKYRRVIWRCNHKYDEDEKCQTPHLYEDEIKELFIKATKQLVGMKDEVMSNYAEMKEMLFGTAELEAEQENLETEINEIAGLIEDCVNENARVALNQTEYEERYNALVARLDFYILNTNIPSTLSGVEFFWKVRNVGVEAIKRGRERGQIIKGGTKKHENTEFKGMHYVECYAIHEGVVIARGRIEVPIDPYSNIRSI